jgi:Cu-Zn family superoxide dismutase
MLKKAQCLLGVAGLLLAATAFSAEVSVSMQDTAAADKSVGTVVISESPYGLLFTPHVTGLTPGIHGFHVHQNPSCLDKGMAAGGHLDPKKTDKHLGPYNDQGHLGDLPVLIVDQKGDATLPVLAPRLRLSDVMNHSLMIHNGGDNYADMPEKLGGGGMRMVCGVIK